uniref:Uncharacterized protein n=1 Tax=Meloidogyne enterolobii TaxID=390850 RepID=A0A6V7X5G2_MELEN|nr:unnamed protein product [Meloidogyne enterolobii]
MNKLNPNIKLTKSSPKCPIPETSLKRKQSTNFNIDNTIQQQSSPRITFENLLGQGRMNQLGGVFINGRPLPQEKRVQIVEMSRRGVKPCKISRELKVSHGAVSKILMRYNETGSISPGQIGGNPRSRISIQAVRQYILSIYKEKIDQNISALQIQQILVERGICSQKNVPSTPRINRLLKTQKQIFQNKFKKESTINFKLIKEGINNEEEEQQKQLTRPLNHSIENILGGSISNNYNGNNLIADESRDFSECQSSNTSNFPNFVVPNNLNDPNKAVSVGSDEENNQQQFTLTMENRRARTAFNQEQLRLLEEVFNVNPYPVTTQKEWLVRKTKLDEDKIITWFSNRRARSRRKALQNGVTNFNNLFIEANNNIISSTIKANFLNQNKFINQKTFGEILINSGNQQQQNQQIFNNSPNGSSLPFTTYSQPSTTPTTNIPQLLPFFSPFGTFQYQNILKTNNQLNKPMSNN